MTDLKKEINEVFDYIFAASKATSALLDTLEKMEAEHSITLVGSEEWQKAKNRLRGVRNDG